MVNKNKVRITMTIREAVIVRSALKAAIWNLGQDTPEAAEAKKILERVAASETLAESRE